VAQIIKLESDSNWSPKTTISSKKQIEYKKTLFAKNTQYSNLKWEDIAGLF